MNKNKKSSFYRRKAVNDMKKNRWMIMLLSCIMAFSFAACKPAEPAATADPGTDPVVPTETPTEAPTEAPETGIDEPLDLPYAADFTVSKAFSKNMVLQRGEHIRVWGWADESENGKKVSGEFLGMFTEAEIKDGEWVLTFKKKLPANAEMGNTLKVYTDTKTVEFTDVLVGDVYMCMGQSNCAYSMANHWGFVDANDTEKVGSKTIDKTLPIRLHYNTQATATKLKRGTEAVNKDVANRSSWKVANAGTVSQFSAIGYLFALNYVRATNGTVPVGVIEIDGNGRPIGAFVPNEVAEACHTDTWNNSKGYYVTEGVNAEWGRFLYNEYMYPFDRYAMAGVIWYQGESDFQDHLTAKYVDTFCALMNHMRGTHNLINKDFAVYYVEFPSIYEKPAGHKGDWHYMDLGKIRAKMGEIVTVLPNSYQIVSSDAWPDKTYFNSLHPNCKYEQGLRGANIALAVNGEGGMTMEKATGPIVESVTYSTDGKTATVKFKNVGSGLKTIDGAAEVKGFKGLSGPNTLSGNSVTAKITGTDTVEVKASFSLAGVAYNAVSANFFGETINLANSEGNPAGAFMLNK